MLIKKHEKIKHDELYIYIPYLKKLYVCTKHLDTRKTEKFHKTQKRTTHKKAKELIYSLFITSTVVKNNKIEIQHHIYTYLNSSPNETSMHSIIIN